MGQVWDSNKGGRTFWVAGMAEMMKEFVRVLKPGAHGFIWALPETSHWTMCAIEDAGFEIRQVVHHIFAQGMPKGQNISKAIDKHFRRKRIVIGKSSRHGGGTNHVYGTGMGDGNVPNLTAPASPEAKQWDGWNSTLKPAVEYWILVRKPLVEKTIVRQVLKTGTGALNIDACRVQTTDNLSGSGTAMLKFGGQNGRPYQDTFIPPEGGTPQHDGGRWPATVLLTHAKECITGGCAEHCPIAVLNAQSGVRTSGKSNGFIGPYKADVYGKYANGMINPETIYGDTGGAGRYFTNFPYEEVPPFYFIAKASPGDRTMKQKVPNSHPTAKSTLLMSWLNTLITPPGGVILDPFCGSGSTLVAAKRDGFSYIGIEQREDYVEIARSRLETLPTLEWIGGGGKQPENPEKPLEQPVVKPRVPFIYSKS